MINPYKNNGALTYYLSIQENFREIGCFSAKSVLHHVCCNPKNPIATLYDESQLLITKN
jgi:hypothetical protein